MTDLNERAFTDDDPACSCPNDCQKHESKFYAFTDEDLRRLKEDIAAVKPGGKWEGGHPWSIRSPELDALLARLDAGEESMLTSGQLRQMADWIIKHGDLTNPQLLTAEILRQKADKVEAWRKAAGK